MPRAMDVAGQEERSVITGENHDPGGVARPQSRRAIVIQAKNSKQLRPHEKGVKLVRADQFILLFFA